MSEKEEIKQGMQGKTVCTCELIKAEYGRTYRQYLCLTFNDGSKLLLHGGIPHSPCPDIEEMKQAPQFFSAEEIADRVLQLERERRRLEEKRQSDKRRDLERLKQELGER